MNGTTVTNSKTNHGLRSRAYCANTDEVLFARLHLYPVENTKVIHLIRHAQGFHNVAGEKDRGNYLLEAFEDAHLSPDGWKQVQALHDHCRKFREDLSVELTVASPMTRTIETAAGIFGTALSVSDPVGDPLLMDCSVPLHTPTEGCGKNTENSESRHVRISARDSPPVIACELCREQLGRNPCDRRVPLSVLRERFPGVDFSEVETESDEMWAAFGPERREGVAEIQERALSFLRWLEQRPETHIAVVSHSAFLTLGLLPLFNGLPTYSPELSDSMGEYFQNCEMRSYILASGNQGCGDRQKAGALSFPGGMEVLDGPRNGPAGSA
uniref:Phosphoglycerate mutase-like protein n=1 Tax=Tetraselmis sp. GSL018 TaxID=582737 RepID=A0A061RJL2_9CHLO|mmetsp:Transcript_21713/g.51901  ORF Transcript_21713/g.51901 Transcript_21713/m.51901 type:complete len:327 (-) Transcript_21713:166-1146(-)